MSHPKHDAAALTAIEEEFFRAGDAMSAASPLEAGGDEPGVAAPTSRGVWSRLFGRSRPATNS